MHKYDHVFAVEPASNAKTTIDWVHQILKDRWVGPICDSESLLRVSALGGRRARLSEIDQGGSRMLPLDSRDVEALR
jgi:hypothetical protein